MKEITMAEFFILVSEVEASKLKLKEIEMETYEGNKINGNFSTVIFSKVRGSEMIKVSLIHFHGDAENPDNVKTISNLEIETISGEKVAIQDIRKCLVYGNDYDGYSIAKVVTVPKNAPFINNEVEEYRHLVVTGIHGNFKNPKNAYNRAAHFKGAKVIRVHA